MVRLKERGVKKSTVKKGLRDDEMACRQHCLLHKSHDPNSNPKNPQKCTKKEKIIFTKLFSNFQIHILARTYHAIQHTHTHTKKKDDDSDDEEEEEEEKEEKEEKKLHL